MQVAVIVFRRHYNFAVYGVAFGYAQDAAQVTYGGNRTRRQAECEYITANIVGSFINTVLGIVFLVGNVFGIGAGDVADVDSRIVVL